MQANQWGRIVSLTGTAGTATWLYRGVTEQKPRALPEGARVVTGLTNPEIAVDFRQDLSEARFAWGLTYEPQSRTDSFFANEAIIDRRERRITAFAETTRFFGVKMRLEASNLFQTRFPRDRQLCAPDRSGTFLGSELLDRERGEFVTFTISDQF